MMGVDPNNPAKTRTNNCQPNHQHRTVQVPMPDRNFYRTPNPTEKETKRKQYNVTVLNAILWLVTALSPPLQRYWGTSFDYRSNHLCILLFRNFVLLNSTDPNTVRFDYEAFVCPWCEASLKFPYNFVNTFHIVNKSFDHRGILTVHFERNNIELCEWD